MKRIFDLIKNLPYEKVIYFICPPTLLKKKYKIGDTVVDFEIPESTEKQIDKALKINWTMVDEFSGQIQYMGEVNDFKTIRKGKAVKVGVSAMLLKIVSFSGGYGSGRRRHKLNR